MVNTDIRDLLFIKINRQSFLARIVSEEEGVISGIPVALSIAEKLGLQITHSVHEGSEICKGDNIIEIVGVPKQIAIAEEQMIGALAKASGIATATRRAKKLAGNTIRIVSGSWKKMPACIKDLIRSAVLSGGGHTRICDEDMIYLDKNYIRMFGSIKASLESANSFDKHTKVVQIKGLDCDVQKEISEAIQYGCDILMVDTGHLCDAVLAINARNNACKKETIRVAFAGNIKIEEIEQYLEVGLDILCIGRDIIDSKLLDMKLDIVKQYWRDEYGTKSS